MMKQLLSILVAAAIGFLGAATWFSSRPAKSPDRSGPSGQSTVPPVSTQAPSTKPESTRSTRPDANAQRRQAEEIIEKLKGIRMAAGSKRRAVQRQVVHQMESLVDLGSPALPVIREFLARFEDLEYPVEREEQEEPGERRERWLPGQTPSAGPVHPPTLDFPFPPSLRVGLIDVLQGIGGPDAEQILAEMLVSTGRGVEIACTARALQEMAPDRYRDAAISAAKDLLANLPKSERANRLDENAQAYLYLVLAQYGDVSFVSTARSLLVTADGQIDRMALNYLTSNMKADAVPALYQAYRDPRITNMSDRANLASQILKHTGLDARANDVFRELVRDAQSPAWVRTMTIQSLAGGRGPMSVPAPTDMAQVQSRIELLNSIQDLADERLTRVRDETVKRLTVRLEAQTEGKETGAGAGAPGEVVPKP